MKHNFTYDDYCRIIGDLYLTAQAQHTQFQQLIENMNAQIANLQKENREIRELCNIPKENS